MFVRLGLFALVLSSASAAMSQQNPPPALYTRARDIEPTSIWQPGAVTPIERARYAFGQCIDRGVRGLDAALPVEAAASSLMNVCAAQLHAVQQEALRVIADAHWSEARKDRARAELQARLDGVEPRVAARISQVRLRTASAAR